MASRLSAITLSVVTACLAPNWGGAQAPDAAAATLIGELEPYRHVAIQTLAADPMATVLVDQHVVRMPGRQWIHLELEAVRLGEGSRLEITSLLDGDTQAFDRHNVQTDTAYFNGDAVRVRLWAGPGTTGNSYTIRRIGFSTVDSVLPASGCTGTDSRVPSDDKRVARVVTKSESGINVYGSAFLISQWNCFATAGHVTQGRSSVTVQFNVPASTGGGSFRHPPASDQYDWTGAHLFRNYAFGEDFAVFTVKRNTNTKLYPAEAQGGYFRLSNNALGSTTMTVIGFGDDHDHKHRNRVQQISSGSRHGVVGNGLKYGAFTLGGCSGGPVIAASGYVHAVHNGCIGNSRIGTRTTHPKFVEWRNLLCQQPSNPDLRPEMMATNAGGTMTPGQTYRFESRTVNDGRATSPWISSGYFMSKDSTISSGDLLVHAFSTKSLSPGEKHHHVANVKLGTAFERGTWYPGVYVDREAKLRESLERNNSKHGAPVTVTGLQDFTVESMQSDSFFIWPDKDVTLTARIKNVGDGAAGFRQHAFYLSSDSTITPIFDVLLGTFSTAALAPNASRTVAKQIKLPHANMTGLCYLGAYADHGKHSVERNENNNSKSISAMCESTPCPDLVASQITASSTTFQADTLIEVRSTIRNLGNAQSDVSWGRYLLSTDTVASGDDRVLWTFLTPRLGQFGQQNHRRWIKMPRDVEPGQFYLIAVADHDDKLAECNEVNNTKALAVTCIGVPDLRVSVLDLPQEASAGALVAMTVHTQNVGTAAAKPSVTGWFLSTDATISTSDLSIGAHNVAKLGANATHQVVVQVRIPFSTPAGSFYIGALADHDQQITELNETDNGRSQQIGITAYTGTGRWIEWRAPKAGNLQGPYTQTAARFDIGLDATANMTIVAPQHVGQQYLCLLSQSSSAFAFDAWTDLGIAFLNGPFFPAWFGQIPANGRARPGIRFPGRALEAGSVYVHVLFFDGGRPTGFANNRLRIELYD